MIFVVMPMMTVIVVVIIRIVNVVMITVGVIMNAEKKNTDSIHQ